jgi:hypothetical protein
VVDAAVVAVVDADAAVVAVVDATVVAVVDAAVVAVVDADAAVVADGDVALGGVAFDGGEVDEAGAAPLGSGTIRGGGSGTLSGTWGRYTTWEAGTRPWLLA